MMAAGFDDERSDQNDPKLHRAHSEHAELPEAMERAAVCVIAAAVMTRTLSPGRWHAFLLIVAAHPDGLVDAVMIVRDDALRPPVDAPDAPAASMAVAEILRATSVQVESSLTW